ncbi:MAG TPA: DUF2889 domain-containing protein [Trebonia sp.]|jgi:hypothetical protein
MASAQRSLPPLGDLPPAPADPRQGTPPRLPGSVRRTSHLNMTWPDGLGGEARIDAAARDLVTPRSGVPVPDGEAELHVTVGSGRVLTRIDATPAPEGLRGLTGHSGGSGYRRLLRDLLPAEAESGSPLHFLLDDIPGVTLVGPFAWRLWPKAVEHLRRLSRGPDRNDAGMRGFDRMRDICSGLRSDGLPIQRMISGEDPQHNLVPARDLAQPGDPLAWHPIAGQPDGAPLMRRRRLVDVAAGPELVITSIFRDSIWGPDRVETCVHEYGLRATADPVTMRLTSIKADPRVLPFGTCPVAGENVGLLLGEPVRTLRDRVIELIAGTDGCTHLNDALRSLAEVPVLAGKLG